MDADTKYRMLLVDDHTLFRKSLVSLLSARPGLQVVGDAENGQEAVEMARELSPDLILMDVQMPVCNGVQAVKIIKREMPSIKIVMLSAFDDDEDLFEAIRNGANGYLLKTTDPAEFFAALDGIRRGEAPISGILAERILQEFRKTQGSAAALDLHEELTPKEVEVLEIVAGGKTNREIAAALCISEYTVKRHLQDIMEKLHLQNRTQLAIYALHQKGSRASH